MLHFLCNTGSEGNQISQKSVLQEHCVVEKVPFYTGLIVLYRNFNKGFFATVSYSILRSKLQKQFR